MSETRQFTTLWTLEHFTTLEVIEMYARVGKIFSFSEDLNNLESVKVAV